jgi:hypothetical protein
VVTQHLDSTVAQVVFAARLLEKAVHHAGPWAISWGTLSVPAKRVLTDEGVIFAAEFPEVCYLEPVTSPMALVCDGEVVAVREAQHPGDTGFSVDWAVQGRLALASA